MNQKFQNNIKDEMDDLNRYANDNNRDEDINLDDDSDKYTYSHDYKYVKKKLSYEEEQIARGY